MATPGVPGDDDSLDLPCGETVSVYDFDMGMREFDCDCGDTHAVVMDAHPLARFVPEFLVEVLRDAVDPADDYEQFKLAHVMGIVLEEFPERVVAEDRSDDGHVGYAMVWVTEFDARRLHEIVVELLIELMEHAVSHADNDDAMSEFERRMAEFDVESFVAQYRAERDLESEHDSAI